MATDGEPSPQNGPRPYRSHKLRACDHCRRRKQRCFVESIGQPCHLCRVQDIRCSYTEGRKEALASSRPSPENVAKETSPRLSKRPRSSLPSGREDVQVGNRGKGVSRDEIKVLDIAQQSTHIVGPVISKDAHVLEQYMSPASPEGPRTNDNPYNVYSADPQMPVLYTKVEKQRIGFLRAREPGIGQRETMEQILAPNARRLVDL
jgi:hypothetical protein